ncbi:AMP-binding protein [Amycolatopsis sacchari]|uniref:AMP-binding protein n=2 Tax=Amycolatopsis sacchari TaxID=115433 RepID=UPI000AAAC731|nr:AMP-binding protein [Amycolatopsis sacchari]
MGPDGPLGHIRTSGTTGTPNEWAAPALGVRVHDHYGQTETGRVINNHHDPRLAAPLKPGTMGRPMPGWTVRVLASDRDEPVPPGETGRIAVDLPAGPLAWFGGYDGGVDPGKFSADGRWYFSGEAGHVDDRGDFHFTARDDDVIITAGCKAVESAVVAVPDEVPTPGSFRRRAAEDTEREDPAVRAEATTAARTRPGHIRPAALTRSSAAVPF